MDSFKVSNPLPRHFSLKVASVVPAFVAEDSIRHAQQIVTSLFSAVAIEVGRG